MVFNKYVRVKKAAEAMLLRLIFYLIIPRRKQQW